MKLADYLSRNPVGGAMPEENNDEEYVINILTEQAVLKLKYGTLFANQSESSRTKIETENGTPEEQNEKHDSLSHSNRRFEKEYGVNKIQQSERSTYGQSEIGTRNSSCILKDNTSLLETKTHQIHIRKLPKLGEKTFIIGALNYGHHPPTEQQSRNTPIR